MLTLQQFRNTGWETLLDIADWWTLVIDTKTSAPLFEIKRGSLLIFENTTLPRLGLGEFVEMALVDKLGLLARGLAVLTVENEDMFLVRMVE